MPELPEVQTTVRGLNQTVLGDKILDIWTDYKSAFYKGKSNIKNPKFFKIFREEVVGSKIVRATRRGKNILIELSNNKTILVHMKMTGFFFYNPPPHTKFIHLIFKLSRGKNLAFSDMRKFASITLIDTPKSGGVIELSHLGPEALDKNFGIKDFESRIMQKPNTEIKSVLMNQTVVAGVGNIYSDELLWLAGVHPRSLPHKIPPLFIKKMYQAMREVLKSGIDFGGDSMSDYRNIHGERGNFQNKHNAYRKTGEMCKKRSCVGEIKREVIGQRSAHFCSKHQNLFK